MVSLQKVYRTGTEEDQWRGAVFLLPPLLLLNLTGFNWRRLEIQRRIDRQKAGSGVLGAWVEMYNPHCFFSLSLFFKALLLAVLYNLASSLL
jgi:hypothetical protein